MRTCWFYSQSEASVHVHDIFKIKACLSHLHSQKKRERERETKENGLYRLQEIYCCGFMRKAITLAVEE